LKRDAKGLQVLVSSVARTVPQANHAQS